MLEKVLRRLMASRYNINHPNGGAVGDISAAPCSDLSPSGHRPPGEPQAHRRRVQPRGRSPPVRRNVPEERSCEDHGGRSCRADRLSALSDEVLHRVLSFLPSSEAVETCLLARRWRHVWKSARALRVNGGDDRAYGSAEDLNKFVNSLLLLRDSAPVDVAEIDSYEGCEDDAEACCYFELWIRYSLSREARVLRVCDNTAGERWIMRAGLITSNHLTVLDLSYVNLEASCLDFTSCPSLENLRMKDCSIEARRIVSPSIQRLSITHCHLDGCDRPQISVPNLILMELANCHGYTPLLESMPLLVSAFVRLQTCIDCCDNKYEVGGCGECQGCCGGNAGDSTSVILEGLSNCTNLELTSAQTEFIFRKDLTRCPVFTKLKTLLINEWYITTSLGALISFLQHSPCLEKLILQFCEDNEELLEMGATYDISKEPFTLKHLTVEVKCHEVHEGIHRILDLLRSYGVPFEQIKIQPAPQLIMLDRNEEGPWPSASFSFEQQNQKTDWDVTEEATSSDSDDCSD